MVCYADYYDTDCGKRYFYVPLKLASKSDATVVDHEILSFLPINFCKDYKNIICKKPNNIKFRYTELTLNNSQILTIEIPFKFSELDFINLLQTWKNDARVVSVQYFGEVIRPHPINKICP